MGNKLNKKSKFKLKYFINYMVIGVILIIFGSLSLSGNLAKSSQVMLEQVAIAMILAVSLSLVIGFLGELSLGHAGFMCVGAYIGGKIASLLTKSLFAPNSLIAFVIALISGAIVASIFGLLIGLPALRLKGDYLAIVTLAFGEIVKTIFQNSSQESFGGPLGLRTPRMDSDYLFIIAFVLLLFTLFVIQNLMRSKHGRAITAIRDNEIAARATGINVTKYKLLAFTISAAFAGIAGVLYSYSVHNVSSSTFGYNYSIDILVMVVLGGMGSINGALLASTVITLLKIKLATVLAGDLAVLQNLIYAFILILIVIYNNAPKLQGFRDKYNIKNLLNKIFKFKHDPSAVKEDAARWDVVPSKIRMDELLSVDTSVKQNYVDIPTNIPDNNNDQGDK